MGVFRPRLLAGGLSPGMIPVSDAGVLRGDAVAFKVGCPTCGRWFLARDDLAGQPISCPVCGVAFQMPSPDRAAQSAVPVATPLPASAIRQASLLDEELAQSATRRPQVETSAPAPRRPVLRRSLRRLQRRGRSVSMLEMAVMLFCSLWFLEGTYRCVFCTLEGDFGCGFLLGLASLGSAVRLMDRPIVAAPVMISTLIIIGVMLAT